MGVVREVLQHPVPLYGGVLMFLAGLLIGFIAENR